MTAKKKRADDPLLRTCPACKARIGQGCRTVGNNDLPLVPRAARLVHAARLEERPTDA